MTLGTLCMVNQQARKYQVLLLLHKTFRVNNLLLADKAFHFVEFQLR